jgi:hypothetical protein
MEQKAKRNFLPHLVAVLTFLIISFIYFSPVLDGKELVGHDTESWIGMSKEVHDYNANNKDDAALWTNSMFGGMPTYQITLLQPHNILILVNRAIDIFPRVVYTLFLYLIGFYILLLSFRVNPWLSMICAFGFAFGSYNLIILAVGHNTKALAIAYMCPLIGSVVMSFRWKRWLGAVLTAFFLGMAILANHLQILYYTLIILLIFGIVEIIYSIIEKRAKEMLITLAVLLGAAAIAIGLNSTNLLTTYEYSDYTMRGKSNGLTIDKSSSQKGLNSDYITQWSYGVDETMTLLIPNYKGGETALPNSNPNAYQGNLSKDSRVAYELRQQNINDVDDIMAKNHFPTYWGTQPGTSGPVYAGAIICFLFVLGLFLVEGKNKWWIVGAVVLSVLLSWGKNFMPFTEFFIKHVPLYNMFRAVSMTLVITTFCMSLMAALALKEFFFNNSISKDEKTNALYISGGIVGGLALIFTLIPSIAGNFISSSDAMYLQSKVLPDFIIKALPIDRAAMLRSDAFRSFVFIALSFGVLLLFLKKNLKLTIAFSVLGVLFLLDMVPIAKRYLNKENFVEKHGEDTMLQNCVVIKN